MPELDSAAASSIEPQPGRTSAPLSRMQQRLVFLQHLQPDKPLYNVLTALRLRGRIEPDALAWALRTFAERHVVLRARLVEDDGQARQLVDADAAIDLTRIDLREVPAPAREEALNERLAQLGDVPFDLATGPLIRFTLFTLETSENEHHVFFINAHHTVWDGGSTEIFFREMAQLYAAALAGKPSPLRPLPIQYGDFAEWHERWLTSEALSTQRKLWRAQLEGDLSPLDLPTDRARPPAMSFDGGIAWTRVAEDDLAKLAEIGRASGTTLFVVLLAAYHALLFRHAAQERIHVGTPVRGRLWPRTNRVVGLFVNTLVIRADLGADLPFRALVEQVRDRCAFAFEHQDVPLDELVRELGVQRDLSRAPIAQAYLSFRDVRDQPDTFCGAKAEEIPLYARFEAQDVTLWTTQEREGLRIAATYATDLFDAATIDRFLEHYVRLLRSIVDGPDASIGSLPMLTDGETALFARMNATELDYPRALGSHQLFAAQARKSPDAIAARFGELALTYGELLAKSHRVARRLIARGVGAGVLVGLCVDRSLDMLVGLYGILAAGGAYVPIDPDYPEDRVSFMLAAEGLAVVLTSRARAPQLPAHGAQTLCLEDDEITSAASEPLHANEQPRQATPESPAYVIFTSGSTGKPKGVQVPHRALTNFLVSMAREPGMTAGDSILAVTTLSFDIAVLELQLPLSVGARIELASREMVGDGGVLRRVLEERAVTTMQATPATFRLLLAAGWMGSPKFKVICGGEQFPKDLAIALGERVAEVWNAYGPTETTVWSTLQLLTPPIDRIVIGHPIGNTQVYVLDAARRRVPLGSIGDLWIGGDGVTLGYLGRPDLTAERFVPDPFRPGVAGATMYLTGDLARILPTGQLECLGRNDGQVKLRGFRIELGEIEHSLSKHPAVKQNAVVLREDRPGDVALVAYLVPNPAVASTATDLRRHLRQSLPEYMIPQHFVELEALPLTPNGKVDRKRLPAPFGSAESDAEVVAPRNVRETFLVDVCKELLRSASISVHDNFFNIGGHSMLALQMIGRVQQRTGVQLSPRTLLVSTLAQIAELLPLTGDEVAAASGRPSENQPTPPAPHAPKPAVSSNRGAFFFGRAEAPLFGFHHPPRGRSRSTGVVLCYPGPQEYMYTHWAFRKLASALSAEGFPVLRFDYRGTGDSSGELTEVGLDDWRRDVIDAAQELRDVAATPHVSIIGFRLGAVVATQAARELDVQDLVLWDPVVRGRDYLDELRGIDEHRRDRSHVFRRPRGDELVGFALPRKHQAELEALDLRAEKRSLARRILVAVSTDEPRSGELAEGLRRSGATVERRVVAEDESAPRRIDRALLANAILESMVKTLVENDK